MESKWEPERGVDVKSKGSAKPLSVSKLKIGGESQNWSWDRESLSDLKSKLKKLKSTISSQAAQQLRSKVGDDTKINKVRINKRVATKRD